jgi:hypothetical protein
VNKLFSTKLKSENQKYIYLQHQTKRKIKMRLNKYHIAIIGLMVYAVILRVINHQSQTLINFSPIAAMALFGSSNFKNRYFGILAPLAVLFVSDFFIGFHKMMFFTYGSFFLIALLGSSLLRDKISIKSVLGTSLLSSVIFFIISNFGVWFTGGYTQNFAGLVECYTAAVPFFRNTIAGDLFYSAILFGAFEYIKQTNWLVKAKA